MNMERTKAIVTIVVTAAVNVANVCGYALDADQWVNVALSVLSAIAILYSWWKNQNVTESAQKAQIYLDELRSKEDADA
jgi:hypothetical protein